MNGIIDIVVNMFTPQEVELGQTGLDENFKKQIIRLFKHKNSRRFGSR